VTSDRAPHGVVDILLAFQGRCQPIALLKHGVQGALPALWSDDRLQSVSELKQRRLKHWDDSQARSLR
jgi:hypothetical protein